MPQDKISAGRSPGRGSIVLDRTGTVTPGDQPRRPDDAAEVGWVGDWRGDVVAFRFQPPPVDPGMRFSRTRLTDVLHRRCSTGARQGRFGLGAMTIPLREISPSSLRER